MPRATPPTPPLDTSSTPAELMLKAQEAAENYRRVTAEMTSAAQRVIRNLIKPGLRINLLDKKSLPEPLWQVQTVSGNDRHTKLFEIVSEPGVFIDLKFLTLCTWRCQAIPLNETTGKPMSGRTSSSSGTHVTLEGNLIDRHINMILDNAPSDAERFMAFLEGRVLPLPSQTPESARPKREPKV